MTVKVMVSFPDEFLLQLDDLAREEQRSRSELLREAVRLYIEEKAWSKRKISSDARLRRAVATQDTLARLTPGTGEDSTADIRRWRKARPR